MKKTSIIWLVVIILVVVVAGYFWWSSTHSSQPPAVTMQTTTSTTSATAPTSSTKETTASPSNPSIHAITLNDSGGGSIFPTYLSASNGMTLYQYTKDADNVSNCTGACATEWPPYTVSTATAASLSADPGILGTMGTIKRANGSLQVTYRGLPLYFYAGDTKPGDTNGEAVNGFTEVAP